MSIRPNPVKQRLAEGGLAYGTMIFEFLGPGLPQIAANAGADFLFYDMEHSGFEMSEIKNQFALCRALDVVPLVRPPGKDYQFVARLLDLGAMGLLYQMVESAAEAEELVSWTRYPGRGRRGAMFGGAHDDYAGGSIADTIAAVEARTMNIMLIETERGLDNAAEIAAVDGVDALHLGHADLSISLGIAGQFDHPRLHAAIDRIAEAARQHGKTAATLAGDAAWGRDLMARGYRMLSWSYDIALMQNALASGLDGLKAMAEEG